MAKLTDLYVNIGAKTDGLKKGLGDAQGQVKGFSQSIGRLGAMIAGAFAVSTVVAFASQVSRLALGADEVKTAFSRLNDPSLLARLRGATSGTVSDLALMKSAIRADSLGIPLKQLGTYFEFAERQAGALGMNTEQVTEAIVNGIGNKSARAFRQLGVSSIEVQKAFAGIEPELLTVESVADRAFVMITEKLREMGDGTVSATDKIDEQAAAWENAKVAFGGFWNEFKAFIAPAATAAFTKMEQFVEAFRTTGGNPNAMAAYFHAIKGQSEEIKKQAKYEEDKARIIAEGDARKRIAEDNARIAAEKTNKVLKERQEILSKLGTDLTDNALGFGMKPTQPDVPIEPFPEDIAQPDMWAKVENNMSSLPGVIDKVAGAFDNAHISAKDFADQVMYLGETATSLKSFAKEAGNAARQFIASQIASGIATIISKTFASTKNPWLGIVLGGVAGGLAAATFNSVVPKFAKGGMTHGPQLAMVGDNPSGKEMIIPSEQWGKMGQNIKIEGIVRGKDLYWVSKNYTDHLNRTK